MSYGLLLTVIEAIELGIKRGLMAIFAKPNELLLDLDSVNALPNMRALDALISNKLVDSLDDRLATRSKGGNTHYYIRTLRPLTTAERLTIQAALGSDPVREILSGEKLRLGSEAVSFLFETPEEAKRVAEWRKK